MKQSVVEFYNSNYDESTRHDSGFGYLQELRTKQILDKCIPKNSTTVLDVGGATGVYSFYLAEKGYAVDLLDIAPKHIAYVKKKNACVENKLKNVILGDIRNAWIPSKYDAIILHGPLYHLTDRIDRIEMLKGLRKNLSDGGVILGFAIHRYAGLFYGLRSGHILDTAYKGIVFNELDNGYNPSGPGWYYHTSKELEEEFLLAGYKIGEMLSVTTQAWMIPNLDSIFEDIDFRNEILSIAGLLERETAIGQDLVCVAQL